MTPMHHDLEDLMSETNYPSQEALPQKPERQFFVVKHKGGLRALPKFLNGVAYNSYDDTEPDKCGNYKIRLRSTPTALESIGVVIVVTPSMEDATRQIVEKEMRG